MSIEFKKIEVINSIVEKFKFEDDTDLAKKGAKTAEEKKIYFLDNFEKNILKMTDQYVFKNGNALNELLAGLADTNSKGIVYWDYIEIDTLLSLQKPKTEYPDEIIFISYHQICELYFKLIIQELERLGDFYDLKEKRQPSFTFQHHYYTKDAENRAKIIGESIRPLNGNQDKDEVEIWKLTIERIIRYFHNLIFSFNILKSGLSSYEFSKFRLALLPASGFQTFQFRKFEVMLTPLFNLIPPSNQDENFNTSNARDIIDKIYWRAGAQYKNEASETEDSKLLKNFKIKYDNEFIKLAEAYSNRTILDRFLKLNVHSYERNIIKNLLSDLENVILLWKIAHMNMVFEHIPSGSNATGGTDYINYLPQLLKDGDSRKNKFNHHQQVIYFPDFWKKRGENYDHRDYVVSKILETPKRMFDEIKSLFTEELGKLNYDLTHTDF